MIDQPQDPLIAQELLLFQKDLQDGRGQELIPLPIKGIPRLGQTLSDPDALLQVSYGGLP